MEGNKPCHPVRNGAQNSFHHGQMFTIVVRLEERNTQIQFKHDATATTEKDNGKDAL